MFGLPSMRAKGRGMDMKNFGLDGSLFLMNTLGYIIIPLCICMYLNFDYMSS